MKKFLNVFLTAFLLSMGNALAFTVTGTNNGVTGTLVNNSGLTYDNTYDASPALYGGDKMGAIVTVSSVTYSNVTFSSTSYNLQGTSISITAHGLPVGLALLLRATDGTVPSPLVAETTYYAIPVSANYMGLATTSAGAVAGTYITLTSSSTGVQTYTLIPIAITGNPSWVWQASNDETNYVTISTFTTTITTFINPSASYATDFGDFNYSIIRLNITAPTKGAINIKATLYIKP